MKNTFYVMAVVTLLTGCRAAGAAVGAATIDGTTDGSAVTGTVAVKDTPEGLSISADLENVAPGMHGFHIHENGSCADEGKAAGGHYNPDNVQHGYLSKDGFEHAHAGDFGNVEIGEDGKGHFETVVPGLTLQGGKYNVLGRAFVLHEKADDFGQPTGNAGGRIGCGPIELTE